MFPKRDGRHMVLLHGLVDPENRKPWRRGGGRRHVGRLAHSEWTFLRYVAARVRGDSHTRAHKVALLATVTSRATGPGN
jgi:hypothetical protein